MRSLEVFHHHMQNKSLELMRNSNIHPFCRLILTVMLNKLNRQMCCEIAVNELVKLTGISRAKV